LERVARSLVPIVLLGETGTGKELLARAIHELSQRSGAFVAINCGALPESLLESQQFGHVRGAFSGATRDQPGYARTADRGTFFLDEIGDMPASSQTALLRVLQEGEVVPVGSTRPLRVDLRVLAATHAPLFERAQNGEFRNDLFARLSGFVFHVTALRDRREDLGLLMQALLPELERAARTPSPDPIRLQPEVMRAVWQHGWPRNIRELQQALSAAVVLSESGVIGLEHLPARASLEVAQRAAAASGEERELEQQLRLRFAEHRGNVTQVAKAMGKARVQVQRWMKRFGIDPSHFR
jgi:transcriptional regulator with PAS, ATPase and Fis domain